MKDKLNEVYDLLIKNQVMWACKIVLDQNKKVSSIIIEIELFKVIKSLISGYSLHYKQYDIDNKFCIVIISKDDTNIDIIEEINNLPASKNLKEKILDNLF